MPQEDAEGTLPAPSGCQGRPAAWYCLAQGPSDDRPRRKRAKPRVSAKLYLHCSARLAEEIRKRLIERSSLRRCPQYTSSQTANPSTSSPGQTFAKPLSEAAFNCTTPSTACFTST